jgi:hypothetical protein
MRKYLAQPSMALNAQGATPYFQMENNYEVPENHAPENILDWVRQHALKQKDKKLKALVIHCHGYGISEGSTLGKHHLKFGFGLHIGTGITRADTSVFSKLKKDGNRLVDEVYLTACGTAAITYAGTWGDGDGNLFCGEIAKYSGAFVYASPDQQSGYSLFGIPKWRQYGIVELEGVVYRYKPDGSNELVVGEHMPAGPPIT